MLVRCVTRHDGRSIAETHLFKLWTFANEVTSIVLCGSSFAGIVNLIMNFSATFEKEHNTTILAAQIVYIVKDMVLPDFQSGNSPRYISAICGWRIFPINGPIFIVFLRIMMGRRRVLKRFEFKTLMKKPFPCPGLKKNHFWFVWQASMSGTRMNTICSTIRRF